MGSERGVGNTPVRVVSSSDEYGFEVGQVWPQQGRIFVTCPHCGGGYVLPVPPFTQWDGQNIGPASTALNAEGCGWHGYVRNGQWIGDTPCKGEYGQHLFKKEVKDAD